MKKIFVVVVCLALSSVAYAQLGGLGNKVKKVVPGSSGGSGSPERVVRNYSEASGHTLNAHARLLSAVGLKDMAEEVRLKAEYLTQGTLSGKEMEENEKIVTESTKALQEKFDDEKTVLDEEGKKEYNVGRKYLAKASLSYTETALEIKGLNVTNNPASMIGAAKLAYDIGRKLPSDTSRLKTVIGMVNDYSKANNIEDDKELEDATSKLDF